MSELTIIKPSTPAVFVAQNANTADIATQSFLDVVLSKDAAPIQVVSATRKLSACQTSELCRASSPIAHTLMLQNDKEHQAWLINTVSSLVNAVNRSYCPNSTIPSITTVTWAVALLERGSTMKVSAIFAFFARCMFDNPYKDVYDMVDKHGLTKDMLFAWFGKFIMEYELEAEYSRLEVQRPPKDKDTTTTYSDLVQKSFDEAQAWDEEVNNYISQQRGIMTHEHEKTFGWRKQSVELVPPIYQLATNTVKHAISEFKSDMFDTISPALPPFIYHKTYLYRFGRLCRIGIYDMLKLNNNIGALIIAYDLPKDHAAAIRHISRWVDNVVAQEYRSYAEDTIRRGDYLLTKKEFRILSLNHLFKHKGLKLNL